MTATKTTITIYEDDDQVVVTSLIRNVLDVTIIAKSEEDFVTLLGTRTQDISRMNFDLDYEPV